MPDPAAQVMIFAKAPLRGTVKTRLAATIGDDAALDIYRRMLWRASRRLGQGPWQRVLCVTPDALADDPQHWPAETGRVPQGDGDLGARMLRALNRASPGAPVIVVGSDIPELDARHIRQALAALARHDLVFGPSLDGGFYLVGARVPPAAGLFADVTWSAPTTLAQVLGNCTTQPALIDRLDDCDDMAAFARHSDSPDWADLLADLQTMP